MKKSVVFMKNQNKSQFMCTCKDKQYLGKVAQEFLDAAARELNMDGTSFCSYVLGLYLGDSFLNAFNQKDRR